MRIVSFNVNGIRARLHQLEALIADSRPDIIGLQETKVVDELFPRAAIEALGYRALVHGQKGHYGVALLSPHPMTERFYGLPGDEADAQRRLVVADVATPSGTVSVLNGYFPQGENRNHPEKFPNKQRFYAGLLTLLEAHFDPSQPLVLMGDMNVAPTDLDIGIGEPNRKRWLREGKCCFLPEEREWLQRLFDWGLADGYRAHCPDSDDRFSWFDYRSRGFEREPRRGLRIDLILLTQALRQRLRDAGIDYGIRAMDKPSDHAPVWVELND